MALEVAGKKLDECSQRVLEKVFLEALRGEQWAIEFWFGKVDRAFLGSDKPSSPTLAKLPAVKFKRNEAS